MSQTCFGVSDRFEIFIEISNEVNNLQHGDTQRVSAKQI